MAQTQTTAAPRTLSRTLPGVDAIFFLALGVLAIAIGVAASLR